MCGHSFRQQQWRDIGADSRGINNGEVVTDAFHANFQWEHVNEFDVDMCLQARDGG